VVITRASTTYEVNAPHAKARAAIIDAKAGLLENQIAAATRSTGTPLTTPTIAT